MTHAHCPLCHNDKHMKKAQVLYGKRVCKKCFYRFANRRQGAFLIDMFIIRLVTVGLSSLLVFQLANMTISPSAYRVFDITLFLLPFAAVAFKDGLGGCSPGKSMCGIQVIDETTLKPIGFLASFKRNLPVLIPLVPLIIALQLNKGHRWGDRWANTRVIWRKFKDHPVFTGEDLPESAEQYLPGDILVARPISDNPYSAPMAPPE